MVSIYSSTYSQIQQNNLSSPEIINNFLHYVRSVSPKSSTIDHASSIRILFFNSLLDSYSALLKYPQPSQSRLPRDRASLQLKKIDTPFDEKKEKSSQLDDAKQNNTLPTTENPDISSLQLRGFIEWSCGDCGFQNIQYQAHEQSHERSNSKTVRKICAFCHRMELSRWQCFCGYGENVPSDPVCRSCFFPNTEVQTKTEFWFCGYCFEAISSASGSNVCDNPDCLSMTLYHTKAIKSAAATPILFNTSLKQIVLCTTARFVQNASMINEDLYYRDKYSDQTKMKSLSSPIISDAYLPGSIYQRHPDQKTPLSHCSDLETEELVCTLYQSEVRKSDFSSYITQLYGPDGLSFVEKKLQKEKNIEENVTPSPTSDVTRAALSKLNNAMQSNSLFKENSSSLYSTLVQFT